MNCVTFNQINANNITGHIVENGTDKLHIVAVKILAKFPVWERQLSKTQITPKVTKIDDEFEKYGI